MDRVRPMCSGGRPHSPPAARAPKGIERTRGTLSSREQTTGPQGRGQADAETKRLRRASQRRPSRSSSPRVETPSEHASTPRRSCPIGAAFRPPKKTPLRDHARLRNRPVAVPPAERPAEESAFGERAPTLTPQRRGAGFVPPHPYAANPPPEIRGVFSFRPFPSPKTNTAPHPCRAAISILSPAAGRRAAPRRTVDVLDIGRPGDAL